jgi:hypothetical protein
MRLKAIYKELLERMEKWFRKHVPSTDSGAYFDLEVINLKRLLDLQDMSELLNLIEFIFVIVMRVDKSKELIE